MTPAERIAELEHLRDELRPQPSAQVQRTGKISQVENCGEIETARKAERAAICAAEPRCKFCGDVRPLDQHGHCSVCVNGMARTKGD